MSASVSYQIIVQWPASDFGIILTVTYDTGSPFGVYHVDSSIFDQKPGGFTYTYTLSGEQSGVSLSTGSGGSTDRVRFDFNDITKDSSFMYHLTCRDNYYQTTVSGRIRIFTVS